MGNKMKKRTFDRLLSSSWDWGSKLKSRDPCRGLRHYIMGFWELFNR
jgi:hypothetical protein